MQACVEFCSQILWSGNIAGIEDIILIFGCRIVVELCMISYLSTSSCPWTIMLFNTLLVRFLVVLQLVWSFHQVSLHRLLFLSMNGNANICSNPFISSLMASLLFSDLYLGSDFISMSDGNCDSGVQHVRLSSILSISFFVSGSFIFGFIFNTNVRLNCFNLMSLHPHVEFAMGFSTLPWTLTPRPFLLAVLFCHLFATQRTGLKQEGFNHNNHHERWVRLRRPCFHLRCWLDQCTPTGQSKIGQLCDTDTSRSAERGCEGAIQLGRRQHNLTTRCTL